MGSPLTPPYSDAHIPGLLSFCGTKLNFYCAYLDTNWVVRTVAFADVGVLLISYIPVHGMMKILQNFYPYRRDELVKILGICHN